jgi:hypothetical protein
MFLIFSAHKKVREKSLKTHPFPLGMKCTVPSQSGKGRFKQLGFSRDETYGDVQKLGYTLRGHTYGDETYGDITYEDVSY